jgi:two-component system, cell cycle sensor histidine kinase and response regulator CckA
VEEEIRVLQLEDNDADGELIALALRRAGLPLAITRVDNRGAFLSALEDGGFELILSDFSLPNFDGLSALAAVRQRDKDTPFIFVSGTIGEERAVEALKYGATDYILKDRLPRLPAAIRRAIQDREERRSRQQAEERIREQAALLDEAQEAIVVQDLDRRVTYWSQGAASLYGWSPEDARSGAADSRFPVNGRQEVDAAWDCVLRDGKWRGSMKQVARDGAELIVESHWTCLRNSEGAARAVLSITSDVTQARKVEAQLLRAQRLETVGTIASGVAHDLNNVLAPIVMGLGSLKRRVLDEQSQRLLGAMEVSADRGTEIVHQVLTFARGGGGGELNRAIDAKEVVQAIEQLLAATLPGNVPLALELPIDLWTISGDPTQIQQVLLNLCVNGRDAMPKGGNLTIKAENVTLSGDRAGGYVCITVSDTGLGMDKDVQEKIFEPFFTTKAQGTGIGLSTVAQIVKRHGGFIEVESAPGRGTAFMVYLPSRVRTQVAEQSAEVRSNVGQGQLLLVVDEGAVREMIRETLQAYGFRVVSADNRNDALREYAKHQREVAAVLVNTSLPDLQDVDFVRDLAERNHDVRVINMSGSSSDHDSGAMDSTVRATLTKPCSADKLIEVVGQVLGAE